MGAEISKGKYSKMGNGLQHQTQTIIEDTDTKFDSENELNATNEKNHEEPLTNGASKLNDSSEINNVAEESSESQSTTIEKLKKGVIAKINSNYEEIPTEDSN